MQGYSSKPLAIYVARKDPMEQSQQIVAKIEQLREERGIGYAELARRIHVDRKRLWYVLKGERAMHVDEFVRLCAIFNLKLEAFIPKSMAKELSESHRWLVEEFGEDGFRNNPFIS